MLGTARVAHVLIYRDIPDPWHRCIKHMLCDRERGELAIDDVAHLVQPSRDCYTWHGRRDL